MKPEYQECWGWLGWKRSCAASYDREDQQTALLTGPALPRLARDQPWNTHTDTDFLFKTNKLSVCISSHHNCIESMGSILQIVAPNDRPFCCLFLLKIVILAHQSFCLPYHRRNLIFFCFKWQNVVPDNHPLCLVCKSLYEIHQIQK